MCGGLFLPLVGMAIAILGILMDRRAAVICAVALSINAAAGACFWLWWMRQDGFP